MLRNPNQEHIFLINEEKEYELVPYTEIKDAAGKDERVRTFVFGRKNRSYAVCWHKTDSGKLCIPLSPDELEYEEELGGSKLLIEKSNDSSIIELKVRRYLSTNSPMDKFVDALINSKHI